MIALGIDPGKNGAFALVDEDFALVRVEDMPTKIYITSRGSRKRIINAAAIDEMAFNFPYIDRAFLEKVSARPGQGVTSMFNFGEGYGIVKGILASRHISHVDVSPQRWKKACGLIGCSKDASRIAAIERWPGQAHWFRRKKDVDRADASLIALVGMISLKQDNAQ